MTAPSMPIRALSAVALAASCVLAACSSRGQMTFVCAQGSHPDAVKVPAGNKVAMETVGVGEITCECRAKAMAAATTGMGPGYEWVFAGPKAVLNGRSGKMVGMYSGPPATWESVDGSKITATQLAAAPAGAGNMPCQLVKANPAMGSGAMNGVTHIRRVATRGGPAPGTPCGAAMVGQMSVVNHQADCIFYKASQLQTCLAAKWARATAAVPAAPVIQLPSSPLPRPTHDGL